MQEAPVPQLDLLNFLLGGWRAREFCFDLGHALRDTGFFYLRNHGLDQNVIRKAWETLPHFFVDLSDEVRRKYEYPKEGRQWGYTSKYVETGEHAKVADNKHFFHFRREHPVGVVEAPGFIRANTRLMGEFDQVYQTLMQAVALSLELGRDHFADKLGWSLLRVIHYPAEEAPQTSDERVENPTAGGNAAGMCASRHTDISMLTLLLALDPGLELRYGGAWLPMHLSTAETLIVNCGDMLEHLTGGRYKSGEHRVVCEPGKERYSLPFFGHLKNDVSLVPLRHLGESDLARYHHQTAGEFLEERIRQIGLRK